MNIMKKVFLLVALAVFLSASYAPVHATGRVGSGLSVSKNLGDPKIDKKTENKGDTKCQARCDSNCVAKNTTACGAKNDSKCAAMSDSKCCEKKSPACCAKSKAACDTRKAEDTGKKQE